MPRVLWRTSRLVVRTASADLRASSPAKLRAIAPGSSTTFETSPKCAASTAGTLRPLSKISMARGRPIRSTRKWLLPPSSTMPRSTNGKRRNAAGAAKTTSHCSSMVAPMPMAAPCTTAIIGTSSSYSAFKNRNTGPLSGCGHEFSKSARSLPAQKLLPEPVSSTARLSGSACTSRNAASSSPYNSAFSALCLSGRLKSSTRIPG